MPEENVSAAEQKARQDGWVPKEEWVESGRNEAEWVNPQEFNLRGDLMGRISQQSKYNQTLKAELSNVKKVVAELANHNKQMREHYRKQAIQDLREAKAAALEEHDGQEVLRLENAIDEITDAAAELDAQEEQNGLESNTGDEIPIEVRVAYETFKESPANSWYDSDVAATAVMNEHLRVEVQRNPNADFNVSLEKARQKTIKDLPHKFKGVRSTNPTVVDGEDGDVDNKDSSGKKTYSISDFTPEQQEVIRTFAGSGIEGMDEQEYMRQLVELEGL